MKALFILPAALMVMIASASASTISWPVGSAGTGTQTRTLLTSFGDFNPQWDTVDSGNCNFHTGIDIQPYNNNLDVRAAKGGTIAKIDFIGNQWYVVIVDPLAPDSGWGYQHLADPLPYGWSAGLTINENDLISEMDTSQTNTPHIHFQWVPSNGVTTDGSQVNPLDSLYNSNSLSWEWNRVL